MLELAGELKQHTEGVMANKELKVLIRDQVSVRCRWIYFMPTLRNFIIEYLRLMELHNEISCIVGCVRVGEEKGLSPFRYHIPWLHPTHARGSAALQYFKINRHWYSKITPFDRYHINYNISTSFLPARILQKEIISLVVISNQRQAFWSHYRKICLYTITMNLLIMSLDTTIKLI